MFRYEIDSQELKGRQTGFSEKLAGMWLGYNYTFIPASVNLIVAGLQEDADHTMENTIRGLDMLINTQFYLDRKRGGDSKDTIISVNSSQVRSQTAKDKPQTLSRYAPTFVLYEEVGKGKKGWSLEVEKYVRPSIHAEGRKTGYQIYIGTGGDIEEGVFDLEQRYFKPDYYNILSFKRRHTQEYNDSFGKVGAITPKWMFLITDKDGNSLRRESIAKLEKEAAQARLAMEKEAERSAEKQKQIDVDRLKEKAEIEKKFNDLNDENIRVQSEVQFQREVDYLAKETAEKESLFNCACALPAALCGLSPSDLVNSAANLGKNSDDTICPCSNILPSSCVVTPIDLAAILKAPGNLSPSCPLNSSALTVPLLII